MPGVRHRMLASPDGAKSVPVYPHLFLSRSAGATFVAMARAPRVIVPDGIYHVTARGSNQGAIFIFDRDRLDFLDLLSRVVEDYELVCHAYCLMTNHYHLVLETRDARLSNAMKALNGTYARRFDVRHSRTAHVFRNRFRSEFIDSDEYLLTACRYVVLNPVRARLCGQPGEWPWSSYRSLAGIEPARRFLSEGLVLSLFGDPSDRARAKYRAFVADGIDSSSCLTPAWDVASRSASALDEVESLSWR
jgi:REP-associated tyrosine transposase